MDSDSNCGDTYCRSDEDPSKGDTVCGVAVGILSFSPSYFSVLCGASCASWEALFEGRVADPLPTVTPSAP